MRTRRCDYFVMARLAALLLATLFGGIWLRAIACSVSGSHTQQRSRPAQSSSSEERKASASHVNEIKRLHSAATRDVMRGRKLDSQITDNLLTQARDIDCPNCQVSKERPTYEQVLSYTEEALKEAGESVRFFVKAIPNQCTVKYKPVAGGDWTDAGLTTVDRKVYPRFYIVACECEISTREQKLDCTNDCSTKFLCNGK